MLALQYDNEKQRGDLVRNGGNFAQDASGLMTAVVISLFSDGERTPIDETGGMRGGWWADVFTNDPIGNRIWILMRNAATDETAALVEDEVQRCLQWMVDDGVALSVAPSAQWVSSGALDLTVTITQPNGGVWTQSWRLLAL